MSKNDMVTEAFNDWLAVFDEWGDDGVVAADQIGVPPWPEINDAIKMRGNAFARMFLTEIGFVALPVEQFDRICNRFSNAWYEGFVTGILYSRNEENNE